MSRVRVFRQTPAKAIAENNQLHHQWRGVSLAELIIWNFYYSRASEDPAWNLIARLMMKMTIGINKNYFKLKHPVIGDSILAITCVTCHNGQPRPGEVQGN